MRKLNFYKYSTLLLLVVNLGIVAFFFTRRPSHRPVPPGHSMEKDQRQRFQEKTMQVLDLDEAQRAIFVKLATEHHEQINAINEQQKELLIEEFDNLTSMASNVDFYENMQLYERLEGEKISAIFAHFKSIKAILKKEQLTNFEEYMKGAKRHLLRDKRRKKR